MFTDEAAMIINIIHNHPIMNNLPLDMLEAMSRKKLKQPFSGDTAHETKYSYPSSIMPALKPIVPNLAELYQMTKEQHVKLIDDLERFYKANFVDALWKMSCCVPEAKAVGKSKTKLKELKKDLRALLIFRLHDFL